LKIRQARRVVRELLKLPIDRQRAYTRAVSAQDTLEFAAMLLGIKPVLLLGRGFDDPAWISAISQIASNMRVTLIDDSCWHTDDSTLNMPAWFLNLRTAHAKATYISVFPSVISEIRKISARGYVTSAEEARLLGYPKCCVEDHHHRALMTEKTFFKAVMRVARGEEQAARRILVDDVKFHLTDEEETQMKWAQDVHPCPFTGFFMCPACAASDRSPARLVSRQYMKLARDVDSDLFDSLEESARFEESMIER
jgi:hypothetical protein